MTDPVQSTADKDTEKKIVVNVKRADDKESVKLSRYRVSDDAPCIKIMKNFCSKRSIDYGGVHFTWNALDIYPETKPREIGMGDGAVIICAPRSNESEAEAVQFIILKIVDQIGNELKFRLNKNYYCKKLMERYCKLRKVAVNETRFIFDGSRVKNDATPLSMGMQSGDIIEAFSYQIAGFL